MSYEYQQTFSDYEVPRRISIIMKVAAWILMLLSVAVAFYLWVETANLLYPIVSIVAGGFTVLCIYYLCSLLDLLMQIRDNTKK